jgi:hypothetical protein
MALNSLVDFMTFMPNVDNGLLGLGPAQVTQGGMLQKIGKLGFSISLSNLDPNGQDYVDLNKLPKGPGHRPTAGAYFAPVAGIDLVEPQ